MCHVRRERENGVAAAGLKKFTLLYMFQILDPFVGYEKIKQLKY